MEANARHEEKNSNAKIAALGGILIALVMILSNLWMGQSASRSTEEAVRSVSDFYLQELAGRREQIVSSNLNSSVENIRSAISLLEPDDLSDPTRLQAFQSRIKRLYNLEKFAFVDTTGLIYTSAGTQGNIGEYGFDYRSIREAEISIKDIESAEKKVVIAVPVNRIPFGGRFFAVCFMEIDIRRMLEGLSLQNGTDSATFCNLYYENGISLTNLVLGGQSEDDNLFQSLEEAEFSKGFSLEKIRNDFREGREGAVSFAYRGASENMYYTPVKGTDWMLTYLIRDSIISEKINVISRGIVRRNMIQTLGITVIMFVVYLVIARQRRIAGQLALEKETAEAESRAKQEELEARLLLQKRLLERERQQRQADNMIQAMAADYRSVYYVNLDKNEVVCYRADASSKDGIHEGDSFPYLERFNEYAEKFVAEDDRPAFLRFIEPENVRAELEREPLIAHRYLTVKNGEEHYELLRIAGVRNAGNRSDEPVREVGLGFSDVDRETRESMAQSHALSDALAAAEEANRAKTAFLSNMSHEIRTPMNAIIGLDSIALNNPDISEKTREYLEKIGASARHLLGLINDILDISRIEAGRVALKREEFSFQKLLEQINTMIDSQCREKGLSYECQIRGELSEYYIGDSMKLKQVVINILGNAVKFTPEGGRVTLGVERVARYEGNATLRFTMKDTGIGMDKAFLPKLFEAFSQEDSSSTNKYGSTGLGMAITKNIVETMNGDIEVESEKGAGTTFTVTVTLLESGRRTAREKRDFHPQGLSVLVIDDDEISCEHAKLVLEKMGVSTEIAMSGAEAVEMVKLRHARRASYDLILVDWKMPEMDGVETTRQIRAILGGESAIIILTAYNWDDVLEDAVSAGVNSFIAKPLSAENVLNEFQSALAKETETAEVHKADLTGRRILLAEDMEINAEIMAEVLQMREMEVERAENGKIAVDLFASHPEHWYDAILMDMRMPVMNGLDAASAIRAMSRADAKTIPIIALTANAFDEDVQRSLQAGLNAHLSKPVEPESLFSTLETFIR
ncbi:MAG: response regulator [Oscillibacter sp.]|nr:response regulator [Oscillibacter sp.]